MALVCAFFFVCAGCGGRTPLLVPHPPGQEERSQRKDFALAFIDTVFDSAAAPQEPALAPAAVSRQVPAGICPVRTSHVRVLLQRTTDACTIYLVGKGLLRAPGKTNNHVLQGRVTVKAHGRGGDVLVDRHAVSLPCTVSATSTNSYVEFDGTSYRGAVILIQGRREGTFGIVNYCNMESYLQGVVPREIGHPGEDALEAVKAQAVAARTYAYKRLAVRHYALYDLHTGVADQVYGGVTAESALGNRAVQATAGMVLMYRDSLVHAYYHSTCGGSTDNIETVWNKSAQPYLVAFADTNTDGTCFCTASRYFTWETTWDTDRLSAIAHRYAKRYYPHNACTGTITGMNVESRTPGGRVARLRITTTKDTYHYGGDKIRFILRRDEQGHPIMRSALLTHIDVSRRTVIIRGRGYGHGVGMCQVGAIARARAGQSFEGILQAYYPDTHLAQVEEKG